MRKIALLIIALSSFFISYSQHQGIGIRLGDPMGLTFKKYLNKRYAVEIGLGTSGPGWHHDYHRNTFENANKFKDFRYRSHQVRSTVYLQARYLIHEEIEVRDLEGKWDWYWGLGGVLKAAKVRYRYEDTDPPFDETELHSDIDLGPEGIIGMEYTFQDVPLSVFGEVSLMLEIVDRITLQPFGGAGIRYNF